MTTRVFFARALEVDLEDQTRVLLADDRVEWATRLMDEIEHIARTLAEHPQLGHVEIVRPEVRKIVMPTLPYVLRYRWVPAKDKITVLRLFHARQNRPLRARAKK